MPISPFTLLTNALGASSTARMRRSLCAVLHLSMQKDKTAGKDTTNGLDFRRVRDKRIADGSEGLI